MDTGAAEASGKPGSDLSSRSLSRVDLQLLLREADFAARRLVRTLRLPAHEREDLRQDLLVDLIVRLKWFDPTRGSLGAFAGTILRHRAARLANRIRRECATFASIVARDESSAVDGTYRRESILDENSPALIEPQVTDGLTAVEHRIDLDQALGALGPADIRLCAALMDRTPNEMSQYGNRSRASIYRDVREIRMRMLMAGVSA